MENNNVTKAQIRRLTLNDEVITNITDGYFALSSEVYNKNEVSSLVELSTEFAKYAFKNRVYDISATSSSFEISDAITKLATGIESAWYDQTEKTINIKFKGFDTIVIHTKDIVQQLSAGYGLKLENNIFSVSANYALSSEVSSITELSDAFANCSKLSIKVSSDAELSAEFAKYQLSGNYALSCEVSSKEQLSNEFAKYQLSGKYALSSEVYNKNEVSSLVELSAEFAKYQLSGNYAISNEVSSKEELSTEFAKYQLSGDYALSSDVSSQLSVLNKKIDNKVFLNNIDENLNNYVDEISVIKISADEYFEKVAANTEFLPNTIFVVESDYLNAAGRQLCNLTMTASDDETENYEGIAVTDVYVNKYKVDKIGDETINLDDYTVEDYLKYLTTKMGGTAN